MGTLTTTQKVVITVCAGLCFLFYFILPFSVYASFSYHSISVSGGLQSMLGTLFHSTSVYGFGSIIMIPALILMLFAPVWCILFAWKDAMPALAPVFKLSPVIQKLIFAVPLIGLGLGLFIGLFVYGGYVFAINVLNILLYLPAAIVLLIFGLKAVK